MYYFRYSVFVLLFISDFLFAGQYYLDPVNGQIGNPGTVSQPLPALEQVVKAKRIKSGDMLILRNGYHGDVTVKGMDDVENVVLVACKDEKPQLRRLQIRGVRRWTVDGLYFSPAFADKHSTVTLIDLYGDVTDTIIKNCRLFSVEDISGWSDTDWVQKACGGINVRGSNNKVINNTIRNIDHGINLTGMRNIAENNLIENFSGDGMRVLGDYCIAKRNTIRNCYDVDDNHDDGIQSWSSLDKKVGAGVVKGVVLDGNIIINYTDPNQRYRGTLQGIGCFDGFYEDWKVINNIIIVDHYHGISLYGARNCTIINNTVIDPNKTKPGPVWIMITKHKNGTAGSGNVVQNNLASRLTPRPEMGTYSHNIEVNNPQDFFRDFSGLDLRLKPGCPAVDAGIGNNAPDTDFLGFKRPCGRAVDIGACEYVPGK